MTNFCIYKLQRDLPQMNFFSVTRILDPHRGLFRFSNWLRVQDSGTGEIMIIAVQLSAGPSHNWAPPRTFVSTHTFCLWPMRVLPEEAPPQTRRAKDSPSPCCGSRPAPGSAPWRNCCGIAERQNDNLEEQKKSSKSPLSLTWDVMWYAWNMSTLLSWIYFDTDRITMALSAPTPEATH